MFITYVYYSTIIRRVKHLFKVFKNLFNYEKQKNSVFKKNQFISAILNLREDSLFNFSVIVIC